MPRNTGVEQAVRAALNAIDEFILGHTCRLPRTQVKRQIDELLATQSNSVKVASLHLAFYALEDDRWDVNSVPTGIRGKYGDKLLAAQLSSRHLTLHNNITAFGENLGWKGNVSNVVLDRDPRFTTFARLLRGSSLAERQLVARYLAWRFADSRSVPKALPPVGADVLTFARAKELFHTLLDTPSEGIIPQFLLAALLFVLRRRHSNRIETHHPHAADKYDRCAGDIEEFGPDGQLKIAYEVTMRPDWKNRLPDFRDKMDAFDLVKYVIIAGGVNKDHDLAVPARLVAFLEPLGRDLAVVDILDFVHFMAAELSARELREAINKSYDYLAQPKLCGRSDVMAKYREVVENWLDEAG